MPNDLAIEVARVATSMEKLEAAFEALAEDLKSHHNRIGSIENKCAAHQVMAVTQTRTDMAVEGHFSEMDERIRALEKYRDETSGMGRASLGILRDVVMVATLLVAIWQMTDVGRSHHTEASRTATTQQVK